MPESHPAMNSILDCFEGAFVKGIQVQGHA